MAAKKSKPTAELEQANPVKVVSNTPYPMRHPITNVMFIPGQPVEINNLDSEDHTFVRHQIEAGIFEVV